ncbi:MAG: LamG domain-containing protein [Acidobacteriota bacterium]|nr:LamG domain-containing protein [Acidobacteriota bacterium]
MLFLFQFFQAAAFAQTSQAIPQVGGILFASNGSLLRLKISGNGQDIAVKGDVPLSLITELGGTKQSFKVNRISLVSAGRQAVSLSLSSSDLPEVSAIVEFVAGGQSVKVTVVRVSNPIITGISAQFQIPEDFDCQLGFPSYSSFHHSCSNARGTVAAFCITGNCDNTVQFDAATMPRFGATLSRTPIQELAGSSFVIFTVPNNHKTLAFLKEFSAFRQKFGSTTSTSSSLFFTTLPTVNETNCANEFLCPARVQAAAKIARSLGFEETILEGSIWVRTTGEFDPRPNLDEAMNEFKNNGVCPVLHTLVSELHPYNALCTPNAGEKPGLGGFGYRCPTNAAKTSPTGRQFINAYGSFYLWDGNQRSIFDRAVTSYVKGVTNSGACGIYADGADWFGEVHPQLGQIYLAEIARTAPNLRLRSAISGSPNALHVRDVDWTDVWQIKSSHSPKDWTFNWGYLTMQGWHEHLGVAGRLGWVPPPRVEDTPENYLPMLNAAVATGSFITIETAGDDASLTSPHFAWFRTALRETIDAVKEIRSGESEGMPVTRTARYDLTHFSNGVSTVALFDSIIPAAVGSKLDARSYGVKIDKGIACRNQSAGCFYFKGTPRMPAAPNAPRLTDGGSFIFAPGNASTRTKNFTLSTWLKAEQTNPTGGLFEKGNFGYGLYLSDGKIGGHTTGAVMGSFYNNPYFRLENPQAWNHFLYSYNDQDRRVKSYLNGKLVLDLPFSNSPSARVFADSPIFVGTTGDAFANFRGWLDGVMLYDRAISDAEAIALFNGNSAAGNPVISWSAVNSSPPTVLDITLQTQRVVYLVPMLEGERLPPGKIRLTFNGFRGKASSAKIQTSIKFRRKQPDSNTLVIELDSTDVGVRFSRIAVSAP